MISKDSNIHECEYCMIPCPEEEMQFFSMNGGGNIGWLFCNSCIDVCNSGNGLEILGKLKILQEEVADYRQRAQVYKEMYNDLKKDCDVLLNNIEAAKDQFKGFNNE